jgi:AcrR family transcriptional regulator
MTATTTQRHDDPRVERTRAAVVEAAADLLTTEGPGAVTHAGVAAAANVSRTTVYNHWPTREDLLRATIESVGKLPPDVDSLTGDLRTDLGQLFEQLVADLVDEQRAPMIANMMERALHDSAVVTVRNEFLAAFERAFRTVVEAGVAAGQLRSDIDVARSMAGLAGSFLFARFMTPAGLDREFADAVLDDFVTVNAPR